MGMTKSAVVGRAHRLDLTPKPSPIKPAAAKVERMQVLLPPDSEAVLAALAALPRYVAPRVAGYTAQHCMWPFGKPGTRAFRFCGRPQVVQGACYCLEHRRKAKRQGEGDWRERGATDPA
jgi:GcrA cell cycle regulator